MKTIRKLFVLLLSAGMMMAFTSCSSSDERAIGDQTDTNTSAASDNSEVFTFDDVGFSYELPEDLHIEKGSIDKADFGELSYGSGVMMGYPRLFCRT